MTEGFIWPRCTAKHSLITLKTICLKETQGIIVYGKVKNSYFIDKRIEDNEGERLATR